MRDSTIAALLLALPLGVASAQGLGDYVREVDLLVDTPGTTSSVAGGFFNPAALAIQPSAGLFLAWDDVRATQAGGFAGFLSLRNVGFGMRQWRQIPGPGDDYRVRDYTLAVSGGTRAHTWGVGYAWGGGATDRVPRHERLGLGSVYRCRWGSLGSATTIDLERADFQVQGDLGVRPFGPRLTLFGDAIWGRQQSFDEIRGGYGLEARLLPGLALAGKVQSGGDFSLRLNVAFDRLSWLSTRPHLEESGDRTSMTYAVEVGGPHASLDFGVGPRRYPTVPLRGGLVYQRDRLFDSRRSFTTTLRSIDAIAAEPHAGGVLVDLSGARLGSAAAWELRAQLAGLRATGKRVYVYCERPGLYLLLLASVADEIWMHPTGHMDVTGLATGRTYMRDAMEKLGLGFDELRFFTYKSALEGYSRNSMSQPDSVQRQAMLDEYYATIRDAVSTGRGLTLAAFDSLVNQRGVLSATEAQAFGLVDSLGDFATMRRAAPRADKREAAPSLRPAQPATRLADFAVDPVWREEQWGEPPRIALLYAIGPCDMDYGIRGRVLAKAIGDASRDRRVDAIVLRVDSPGGDVLPSELVAAAVRDARKRKPVLVSQGQVAASGGYWISMDADRIFATPLTLTGSIGVIGGWVWDRGFGDRLGLHYDGLQRGDHADLVRGIQLPLIGVTVPHRPLRPDERQRVEQLIRGTYGDFVRGVATGRGLDASRVDSLAQGRVWTGRAALDRELVDDLGGLWDALRAARDAAEIPAGHVVRITEGPPPQWFALRTLRRFLTGADARESDPALVAADDERSAVSPGLASWIDPARAPLSDAGWLPAHERAFFDLWLRHNGQPLVVVPPIEVEDGAVGR